MSGEPDDNDPPNLNTGHPWTDADVRDLRRCIALGETVEEIASFTCRTRREVRDKAAELRLRPYEPRALDDEQRSGAVNPPMLNGYELTDEDLERLRQQIEAFDYIDEISDEARELIAERWPHLLAKLKAPPKQ
jgi:hypothetical protein